jgi:hypothetical protein
MEDASRSGHTDWNPRNMLRRGPKDAFGSFSFSGFLKAYRLKTVWHVDRFSPRVGPALLLLAPIGQTVGNSTSLLANVVYNEESVCILDEYSYRQFNRK